MVSMVWVLHQAIVMVLESKGDKTCSMVLQLLQSLANSSVITVDQIRRVRRPRVPAFPTAGCFPGRSLTFDLVLMFPPLPQGYDRVYTDISDINIDVPRAYSILEQFVEQSFSIGIIDARLRDDCPCR